MAVVHTDRDSYTSFVKQTSPAAHAGVDCPVWRGGGARDGGGGFGVRVGALEPGCRNGQPGRIPVSGGVQPGASCAPSVAVARPRLRPRTEPLVEPGLPAALMRLTDRQRVSVMMVHGAGWTVSETAELLGISAGSVYRHVERGLRRLRRSLEVTPNA